MPGVGSLRSVTVADLRHRGVVERQVKAATDDRGRKPGTWTKVTDIRFRIKQLTASDIESARQLSPESTHRVFIRADPRITTDMRIVFGARVFHIGAIDDIDTVGRFMVILVAEVTAT